MEAVAILRQLWRQRLLVAVGVVLSLMVGIAMAYRVTAGVPPKFESRQYNVGIATAEVLVDSPSSQVADLGGGSSVTDVTGLASRAQLLANLMAISPLKEQIARRAGVDPRKLVTTAPSLGLQQQDALDTAAKGAQAVTLTIAVNEVLPIITANTQAPTPQIAARLSAAAVDELRIYLQTIAATQKVPNSRKLVISPLGPARFATVARGPRRLFAIASVAIVFGLWCLSLVVGSRLARTWREADVAEQSENASGPPAGLPAERPRPALTESGEWAPTRSHHASHEERALVPELPERTERTRPRGAA